MSHQPAVPLTAVVAALLLAHAPLAAQAASERVTEPVAVSGVVFQDANGNGRRDEGEAGIPGAAVTDQIQVVASDAGGRFHLDARGYGLVVIDVPDGFRSVGPSWRTVAGDAEELAFPLERARSPRAFTFVQASDLHADSASLPRLRRLRAMVDSMQPAFVLITGDLVRDAIRVPEEVATGYYRMVMDELARFTVPVHTIPGNHEKFGIERASSLVSPDHPLYGNRMYRSFLGPDYYAFSYGGVRFLGLNTVDYQDQWYNGHVDSLQVRWIAREVERRPAGEPIVVFGHIPFVSGAGARIGYMDGGLAPSTILVDGKPYFRHTVRNHEEVLALIGRRLEIALAGHIHLRESIEYVTQDGPQRLQTAAAVVGPAPGEANGYGPLSGITLYHVQDGQVDDGTFLPLDPIPTPSPPRAPR